MTNKRFRWVLVCTLIGAYVFGEAMAELIIPWEHNMHTARNRTILSFYLAILGAVIGGLIGMILSRKLGSPGK